jgi:hypothetical protein
MSDNKKTDVVAEARAFMNSEGLKFYSISVKHITALLSGNTQFCAQCEAKGRENAALLKRCEDAEAVVGKLTLEIIDLKQALSQKGNIDDN